MSAAPIHGTGGGACAVCAALVAVLRDHLPGRVVSSKPAGGCSACAVLLDVVAPLREESRR